MDLVLDFITTNYIAFIVGGVVVLLAVIGLIGEKVKKKKQPKEEVKEEPIVEMTNSPEFATKENTENLFGATSASDNTQYNIYGSPDKAIEPSVAPEPVSEVATSDFQYNGYEPEGLTEQVPAPINDDADLFAPFEQKVPSFPRPEPIVEEGIQPISETVIETPMESDIPTEPIVEEAFQPIQEPIVEIPSEPVMSSEPIAEEAFQPIQEPIVETPSEPIVEEPFQSTQEPIIPVEPIVEEAFQPIQEPLIEIPSEPAMSVIPEIVVETPIEEMETFQPIETPTIEPAVETTIEVNPIEETTTIDETENRF